MEGGAVDRTLQGGRIVDPVAGDQIDREARVGAVHVGVLGVLGLAVGQHGEADLLAEAGELGARHGRVEGDEQVDVAGVGEPGAAGGRAHLDDLDVDLGVGGGCGDRVGELGDRRLHRRDRRRGGADRIGDVVEHRRRRICTGHG